MSTRSRIGMINPDGSVSSIYCHFDGYPEGVGKTLHDNWNDINDIISKIYYPVGEYIRLIQKFDIFDLLKLLLINIIPLILFVIITSKHYFTIISKSSENGSSRRITSGSPIIILARATRCCCPPES